MSARLASIPMVVAIATIVAGAALAADARTLVLQRSDFPRGTRAMLQNGNRQGYGVTYRYTVAGRRNDLSSAVVVTPSRNAAAKALRDLASDYSKNVPKLSLPKYGDEQHVSFLLGTAQLIVRKNTVVWTLILARTGSTGSNANEIKEAEATAELKKYAAKQMRRVGSG
jgi:hypothetical protein